MTRDLTHERCANRVCCPSWSCEPHRADCTMVERRHRAIQDERRSLGEPVVRYPEKAA